MKITANQLRQIIAEEVNQTMTQATARPTADTFYAEKLEMLIAAQAHIDALREVLSDLEGHESTAPDKAGLAEITELSTMLDPLEDMVNALASAVEPLT